MNSSSITVAQSNAFVTTFDLSPTDSGPLDGLRTIGGLDDLGWCRGERRLHRHPAVAELDLRAQVAAIETADVALLAPDLRALPGFFSLGRRTVTGWRLRGGVK